MQGRTFEKSIWGITFGLCALMLMTNSAEASTGDIVVGVALNPVSYMIGLLVTFVACKLITGSSGQF